MGKSESLHYFWRISKVHTEAYWLFTWLAIIQPSQSHEAALFYNDTYGMYSTLFAGQLTKILKPWIVLKQSSTVQYLLEPNHRLKIWCRSSFIDNAANKSRNLVEVMSSVAELKLIVLAAAPAPTFKKFPVWLQSQLRLRLKLCGYLFS